MNHDFWDSVTDLLPIVSLMSNILTFLESYVDPLSAVSLAFSFLLEAIGDLHDTECDAMRSSVMSLWNRIKSDVHIQALCLDPATTSNNLSAVSTLLGNDSVISIANRAVRLHFKRMSVNDHRTDFISRILVLLISNKHTKLEYRYVYHPIIWWLTVGCYSDRYLCDVAEFVFSLNASSAGVDLSFKVRSLAHSKTLFRLSEKRRTSIQVCSSIQMNSSAFSMLS